MLGDGVDREEDFTQKEYQLRQYLKKIPTRRGGTSRKGHTSLTEQCNNLCMSITEQEFMYSLINK